MSYILEALKRAEAERQSGVAQAGSLAPGFAGAARGLPASRIQHRVWVAAAILVVVLAGAAWFTVPGNPPPAAAPAVQPVSSAVPPATAILPRGANQVATAPPAIAAAAEPAAAVPLSTPVQQQETPAKKKTGKKQPPSSSNGSTRTSDDIDDAQVATLHDLPEQLRSELPSLAVGGYIYSANRADRSVLINKRLLREGDEIAPGLLLERMKPEGMILNYKGYRYRASY